MIDLIETGENKFKNLMPPSRPLLSCIIVTYHPGAELIECISSLHRFVYCSFEVIISDNTSAPAKMLDEISSQFPGTVIVRNPVNGGFSYGNNRGVERAAGTFLMLLNPDAQLLSPITEEMLEHINRSGIITGVSRNKAKGYKRTVGRFPVNPLRVFSLTGRMDQRPEIVTGNFNSRFIDIDYNEGSCYLLRRDVFVSVEGFDERIFLYGEDYELSYRVSQIGWTNRLDTSLQYLHEGGYSDSREPHIVNGLIYFSRKHFGLWQELKMRSVLLLRYLVLLCLTLTRATLSSQARGRLPSVIHALRNVLTPNPYLKKPRRI